MKIVKYVALALVALAGVLLLVGLCMPQEWTVERSLVVRADKTKIHPLVGNLEGWRRWMPWLEDDPKMTLAFAGTGGAPGSTMHWTSETMGNGTLTVVKSDPATGLEYELTMDEFVAPAHGSIRYAMEGDATRLTWTDRGTLGKNPFVRLFGPVLEGMLGQSFEKGLANVKSVVEGGG